MAAFTVHVSNISYRTTARELGDAFSRYGPVTTARIISDRDFRGTERSAGFGFVDFQTADAASAAAGADPPLELGGRALRVHPARARKRDTIFISGIPEGTVEDDLKAIFGRYNPAQIRIVRQDNQDRRGFAFIQFESEANQTAAHQENRTFQLKGKESRVQFARFSLGARRRRPFRRAPVRAERQAPPERPAGGPAPQAGSAPRGGRRAPRGPGPDPAKEGGGST